jgi:hypothetical protein
VRVCREPGQRKPEARLGGVAAAESGLSPSRDLPSRATVTVAPLRRLFRQNQFA